MKSIHRMLLLAALLIPVPVQGQVNATGSFTGQVTDASGAAVANAKVKVSNQEDGTEITRSTSADGFYTLPLLKPGTYSVEASAPGFGSAVRRGLALQIQQVVQQDFKLIPGTLQQEMTVQGGAPLLNTESTEVGNVLGKAAG
jgi:hypothetical protein